MINPNHWLVRLIVIGISWLLLLVVLFLVVLAAVSCNPIKQVQRNKERWEQVKDIVIESGACKSDTNIIVKSDTLISVDTLPVHDTTYTFYHYNDTVIVTKTIVKPTVRNIRIIDTVSRIVRDVALENVYRAEKDSAVAQMRVMQSDVVKYKGSSQRNLWMFIASIVLNVLLIVLLFKFKTNPLNKVI